MRAPDANQRIDATEVPLPMTAPSSTMAKGAMVTFSPRVAFGLTTARESIAVLISECPESLYAGFWVLTSFRSMMDAIRSASATSTPSTNALPLIWQMRLFRLVIVSSNTS